jgi:NADPH2:quinone reductase
MRALVCEALGPIDQLAVKDVPSPPAPSVSELAIDVHACGINFPDLLIAQGKYQFKPSPPFSPGGEIAGVVREVGPGVASWAAGDRVIAMLPYGGLAERVVVSEASVFRVPDGVPLDVAASVLTTYGTSWHALVDRAHLAKDEWLLVLGAAGGVGVSAIQIGKLLGAKVIAAARGEDKLAFCRENGADAVIDYEKEDLKARVKDITGGAGADVV